MDLVFTSSLPSSYRDALERLVFFNPNQLHMAGGITRALDLYGSPEIVRGSEGLTVTVQGSRDVQCLFALDPAQNSEAPVLAGMLMFLRATVEEVLVVHIAVASTHSQRRRIGRGVVFPLIRVVRASARRLRGVRWLRLLYTDDRQFQIRINPVFEQGQDREPAQRRPARLAS